MLGVSNSSPLNKMLLQASDVGDSLTVRKLLKHRGLIDVNAVDRQPLGESALSKASKGGHWEVVQLLINAGANVNISDAILITPLHLAAKGGHVRVVQLLLASGADIAFKSNNNMYPANYCPYDSEVAQILASVALGVFPTIDFRTDVVPFVPEFAIPKPKPDDEEDKKKKTKAKGKKGKKGKSKKGKKAK